jgi:hypothetical protein
MLGIRDIINDTIDNALKLNFEAPKPLYSHKKACQKLSSKQPLEFDACLLIKDICKEIEEAQRRKPSNKNWCWRKNESYDTKSPEVRLERNLIKRLDTTWANQVPTSSGLVDEHLDKTRNIDLVHWCEDGWYEFIELKVESNTPLFAAMEILQYGTLYIFSRDHRDELRYRPHENPLLWGKGVHLRVLAPDDYYKYKDRGNQHLTTYELEWLEGKINEGLHAFLAEPKRDFDMTFSFERFTSQEDLLKDPLNNRKPVYPISSWAFSTHSFR